MRPGPDRADDLVRLRRREDELQVLRRLLDQLEQGVESLRRDHVRLIDDVDLVAAVDRREEGPLPKVTGVVDAAMARRVDLDHVDGAGAPARQIGAGLAHPARRVGGPLDAVEATRQDPGTRRLAAAARPREEVGVVDPVVGQRGAQRTGDVVLTDDLCEGLRPVATVEREGCLHPCTLARRADTANPRPPRTRRPPAHPTELTDPCCLPALGELGEMTPHGGLPGV